MGCRGEKNILELLDDHRYKLCCISAIMPKGCHYIFNVIFMCISENAFPTQMLSSVTLKEPLWSESNLLATRQKVSCSQ